MTRSRHRVVGGALSADESSPVQGRTRGPQVRPIGPWRIAGTAPIIRSVSERGLHYIEDDLNETWLEDWAGVGVAEIETFLAKHAAFLNFLETNSIEF